MHKVTVFTRAMNAPSVLERKDSCEILVAITKASAHASTFRIRAGRGVGCGERCGVSDWRTDIITLLVLLPKPIEPIAHRKRRKRQKSLIPDGSIMRGKRRKKLVETSISDMCRGILSNKCSVYLDV